MVRARVHNFENLRGEPTTPSLTAASTVANPSPLHHLIQSTQDALHPGIYSSYQSCSSKGCSCSKSLRCLPDAIIRYSFCCRLEASSCPLRTRWHLRQRSGKTQLDTAVALHGNLEANWSPVVLISDAKNTQADIDPPLP